MGYQVGTDRRGVEQPRSRNGGFPKNPVPMLDRVIGVNDKGASARPMTWQGKIYQPLTRFINPPKRDRSPIPVALPKAFRLTPPLPDTGKISKGLGGSIRGLQDGINLHASVLPSNPMAFSFISEVKEKMSEDTNNRPTLRSTIAKLTGAVGSARNAVETTAQNRSPM